MTSIHFTDLFSLSVLLRFFMYAICVLCKKQKKPCKFWHILPTTLMNYRNFKNDIFDFNTTQAKYLSKK